MSVAPERGVLGIRRHFTTPGIDPYDEIDWDVRTSRLVDHRDGSVAFEQDGVEVPSDWSVNATNILAQKYFRGPLDGPGRESSLRQVADRVAGTIADWGRRDGYFSDEDEAEAFAAELRYLIVTQRAAFNSPVWFNIGVPGVPQQASACFILSVEDQMSSILNWYVEEGTIFKGGSGAGVNLSAIRSSREALKGGGQASGPVSFMRGADASAAPSRAEARPAAPPRWSSSTSTIRTSRSSSGARPTRSARSGSWPTPDLMSDSTAPTATRSCIRTPTTPSASRTGSWRLSRPTPTGTSRR